MAVIQYAQSQHTQRSEQNRAQLKVTDLKSMDQERYGVGTQNSKFSEPALEEQKHGCDRGRDKDTGHDRETPGERNGAIVNFSMSRVVHQTEPQANLFPKGE